MAANKLSRYFVLAFVLGTEIAVASTADIEKRFRQGHAFDTETGLHLYTEYHHESWLGKRVLENVVEYRSPNGELIATKRVNFGNSELAPEFELNNYQTGHLEKFENLIDGTAISFRKDRSDDIRIKRLEQSAGYIVDAGFDRFIANYWDEIVLERKKQLPFLVPGFGRALDFEIRLIGTEFGNTVFLLKPKSRLLSFLVDPIELTYESSSRKLLVYTGLSNMRDESGKNYDVRIEFDHSGDA